LVKAKKSKPKKKDMVLNGVWLNATPYPPAQASPRGIGAGFLLHHLMMIFYRWLDSFIAIGLRGYFMPKIEEWAKHLTYKEVYWDIFKEETPEVQEEKLASNLMDWIAKIFRDKAEISWAVSLASPALGRLVRDVMGAHI